MPKKMARGAIEVLLRSILTFFFIKKKPNNSPALQIIINHPWPGTSVAEIMHCGLFFIVVFILFISIFYICIYLFCLMHSHLYLYFFCFIINHRFSFPITSFQSVSHFVRMGFYFITF